MNKLQKHLFELSKSGSIPEGHIAYLYYLKNSGFEPKVIYDIGSSILHWSKVAKEVWPNSEIILFDAFQEAEFLYEDYKYYIGCLSDVDDKEVKFYQNDYLPGGNSYYREIGNDNGKYFPIDKYRVLRTRTIDSVVKEHKFPLPDFVKIDVQGAEIDILKGGIETIGNAERLILELQHVEYNEGAKLVDESLPIIESMGWKCDIPLFQNNGPDGDYSFIRDK